MSKEYQQKQIKCPYCDDRHEVKISGPSHNYECPNTGHFFNITSNFIAKKNDVSNANSKDKSLSPASIDPLENSKSQRKNAKIMTYKELIAPIVVFIVCLLIKADFGVGFFVMQFIFLSAFIFFELVYIRSIIMETFVSNVSDNKVVRAILEKKLLSIVLGFVGSVYLALHLDSYIRIGGWYRILLLFIGSLSFSYFKALGQGRASETGLVKEKPGKAFGRLAICIVLGLLLMTIDGVCTVMWPIDQRIQEPFDPNIPMYVMDHVNHSVVIYQHYLRTVKFIEMNLNSIALHKDIGFWFNLARFFLGISILPYIAYFLLLFSFDAVKKISLEIKR